MPLVILVSLIVVAFLVFPSLMGRSGGSWKVPRRKHAPREVLSSIRALREPVILTQAVDGATKLSDFDFVVKEFPWAIVYQQAHRAFATFHDDKGLEAFVQPKWADFNVMHNVSMSEVLVDDPDRFLYFSARLTRLDRPSAAPEVTHRLLAGGGPTVPLNVSSLLPSLPDFFFDVQERRGQANFWVGRKGLVTHTHFDAQDNFFVQLRGKKRFTLYPPSSQLAFFPCVHPHSGHLFPAPSALPLPLGPQPALQEWVAELAEGEILYIPPYWWHHVETLEDSHSFNVWSDADEAMTMDFVYATAVPVEASWARARMVSAVHAYSCELLSQLAHHTRRTHLEPLTFIRNMFALRWSRLALEGQATDLAQLCARGHFEQLRQADSLFYTRSSSSSSSSARSFDLQRGLDVIVPLLSSLNRTEGVMELLVANFLEHLAGGLLGFESVRPFLQHCFDTPALEL